MGEVITYTLTATFPEGKTGSVALVDSETDADGILTLLDGEVVSVGGQLSSTGTLEVGDTVSASGGTVTFDFGTVTNTTTGATGNGTAEDQVVVQVRAVVSADASNAAGDVLTNAGTLNYDASLSVSDTQDVTVVEPALSFAKKATSITGAGSVTADGDVTSADIGDVVTYQIVVSHDGTAAADTDTPAFNVLVSDTLPTVPDTAFVSTTSFSAGCSGATGTAAPGAGADVDFTVERIDVGDTCTVTYTATVQAGGAVGANAAALEFDTTPGTGDETPRTNSSVPDESASITLVQPVVGVAKQLTTAGAPNVAPNPDGTFDLTYEITVENLGDVGLTGVQVVENLAAEFPGLDVTVTALSATGTLTANTTADFETTDNLLVAASSTLPLGETETVTLTLTVDPDDNLGAYDNQVAASAQSPGGVAAPGDLSDNGSEPDADGDGNPNEADAGGADMNANSDENDPTPVVFAENPVIGVAKDVVVEGVTFAGVYTVRYEYVVENLGNVNLASVQLVDDLTQTFTDPPLPAGTTYTVTSVTAEAVAPTTSVTLTANTNFDGDPDAGQDELLDAGGSTLPVGAVNRVVVRLELDPADSDTIFINQATATAKGPNDSDTTDLSDEGGEPDADADGNPNEDNTDALDPDADSAENNATRLVLVEQPAIGVAKEAGTLTDNQDGSYTVPFTLTVRNYGNIDLVGVQLTDDLTEMFPGVDYSVSDLSASAGLSVNPDYTGGPADPNGTNLLTGTDTLFVNAGDGVTEGTVTFTVTLFPTTTSGDYVGQVEAAAQSPGGAATSDFSDDGTNPDPDGDSLPNEQATPYDADGNGTAGVNEGVVEDVDGDGIGDGETADENDPTPVSFVEQIALIGLAKDVVEPVTNNADGTYTFIYLLTVENLGGVELRNVSVTDDVDAVFGSALVRAEALDGTNAAGVTGLSANPGYDGVSDTEVLTTFSPPNQDQELAVGETGVVRLRVTVEPGTNLGPYLNSARATGTSPGGQTPTDLSDDGTDPDADGDGLGNEQATPYDANGDGTVGANEGVAEDTTGDDVGDGETADENDPTPVTFTEAPSPGVAKRFADLSALDPSNQPGVFEVVLELVVENLGDIEVRNVQVVDDLNAAFQVASGSTYQVTSLTSQKGLLTPVDSDTLNDTTGNSNLLVGADTLARGVSDTLTLRATVTPHDPGVDYENQATVTATSPAGALLSDLSDDGTDPDPDGDGEPSEGGEDDPTPFKFERPFIGLAKDAGVTNNGDGTYTVVYDLLLENLGDVTLDDLSITDDLSATFGGTLLSAQATDGLGSSTAKSLTANPAYDGVNVTEVLAAGQALESDIADTGTVTTQGRVSVAALVRPGGTLGPYLNSATARGTSPGGQTVKDISDNGSVPDEDGDGNADETQRRQRQPCQRLSRERPDARDLWAEPGHRLGKSCHRDDQPGRQLRRALYLHGGELRRRGALERANHRRLN